MLQWLREFFGIDCPECGEATTAESVKSLDASDGLEYTGEDSCNCINCNYHDVYDDGFQMFPVG